MSLQPTRVSNPDSARQAVESHGYAVCEGLIPDDLCGSIVAAICEARSIDLSRADTWYSTTDIWAGICSLDHHQAIWELRQHLPVYEFFAEMIGTRELWAVLSDSVNFKPPLRQGRPTEPAEPGGGLPLHWDAAVADSDERGACREQRSARVAPYQGFVSLSDCEAGGGGFVCVPELYRGLEEWISEQPPEWNGRFPEGVYEPTHVPTRKGDIVIWSPLLPHGNGVNRSRRPRLATYLAYTHAGAAPNAQRVDWWLNRQRRSRFPDDPLAGTPLPGEPVRLDELGRRLLGADPW